MRPKPRILICRICGYECEEESNFPWFVRFGVAGCEGISKNKPHLFEYMDLKTHGKEK